MAIKRERIRYSVRAWTAIIAVLSGPLALLGLFFVTVPDGNAQTFGVVAGLVLAWGGKVIDSQFRSRADGAEPRA